MTDLRIGSGKYKIDLEHLIMPDSKEILKNIKDDTRMQELNLKGQFWDNVSNKIIKF